MSSGKIRLYWRQNRECWYCGRVCRLNNSGLDFQYPNTATIEHQKEHTYNFTKRVVMACYECNHEKGRWSVLMDKLQNRYGSVYYGKSRSDHG